MIRVFLAGLVCLLSVSPVWAEIKIEQVTSPGGIKAWLVEEHGIPFTALKVRFQGGTSLDAPGKRGATMLMSALLEEGAGALDSRGFANARDDLAADFSFDADADGVSVTAQVLTQNRDQAIDLLRTALIDPHFDQVSIDRVRGQVLSIIQSNATDPGTIASQTFDTIAFGDHPYGSAEIGTTASVSALTRDDVVSAKAATMTRDRLYVSAVGDITPQELGVLLDRLLGDLPQNGALLPDRANVTFDGSTTVVDFDTPQSTVIFGQEGLKITDPDYYAAMILNQVIGGSGFTARLMTEVREKRGLTYGVSSDLAPMNLAETWQGGFASSNEKTAEAISVVRDVWADVAENGVTQQEMDAAKTYITGSYPLRFDGNSTIAGILVGMQIQGLPIDYVSKRNALVEAVTLEQVNKVAKERLHPENLTFVVVGKPDGVTSLP